MRKHLLAVVACLSLAACTSRPADEVAPDQPTFVLGAPTGPNGVEPQPPLLPEGVDVLAVPSERVISMWKHPKATDSTFALDTKNPMGTLSPMLIEAAKRRAGEAWYRVLLPLRPNGTSAWVRERDVELRRIDQRIEVDPLEIQLRRALLQTGVGEHFVHQAIEVLDIAVHAFHIFAPGFGAGGVANHLQAEAQARHWRAQFVGHGAHQFALDRQQLLQVLGHAIERRSQAPDRIGTAGGHTHFQVALGDARGRGFQALESSFELAHQ